MKGSKLDLRREEFETLFNQGLSDYKIANIMGVNHCTVFQWRKKNDYTRPSLKENKEIPLTKDNLEIILGTLLGDGSLRRDFSNAYYTVGHGPKQREYCKYIVQQLSNLGAKLYYSKRHTKDPRTGVKYELFCCKTPCNPALNYLYNAFYVNKIKRIPIELLNNFTEKSLAFMYMDGGNKMANGYAIATCCFTTEEITEFRKFLFNKFNLETSMFKGHRIYIKAKSAALFKILISPYMHNSMLYKL